MKTYKIPVFWEMYAVIEIEAEDLDEAFYIAETETESLPTGVYTSGSFQIDYDAVPIHNTDISVEEL